MSERAGIEVDLETLRTRTSAKWTYFDADVLPAWVAEMDFTLAPSIAAALTAAVARSDTGYRSVGRLPEALIDFSSRRWGWQPDASHVMVVPDVMTGIAATLRHVTGPADSVVINSPVYPLFYSTVRDVVGRNIHDVPLVSDEAGRYGWDLDAIDAAFARPEVTAFLLCSPHNPGGTCWTPQELKELAQVCRERNLLLVSDEIHCDLVFTGASIRRRWWPRLRSPTG